MDPQQYGQQPSGQPGYGAPPGYGQQQQYGAPPPPPGSTNRWGPSSIGMEPNLAAGLGYLFGILGLIFFFIEKTNRFVKFHAAQVILLAIGWLGLAIIWTILSTVASAAFASSYGVGGTAATAGTAVIVTGIIACISGITYLGMLGLWLWGMISAFQGKYTKLPIIGNIAERMAGGPAIPAF
jgi:uncharacterized membrane protein